MPRDPHEVPTAELAAKVGMVLDHEHLRSRLLEYYAKDDEGPWAGGYFERLGEGVHGPNEIGCHDLLAVTLLDVAVPAFAARRILFEHGVRSELSRLLEGVPEDTPLWEATDEHLVAANALWTYFEKERFLGMGRGSQAIRSKLLARKRPHLVPITDSVVRGFLGQHDLWSGLRALFVQRPDILATARRLRNDVAPERSVLRVLDAAIWLLNSKQAASHYAS